MRSFLILVCSPLFATLVFWSLFGACVDTQVDANPPVTRLVTSWDPLACGSPHRVVVEGVNVVKKHKRATTPQGESGIIEFPASVAASNVMLLDPKSGEPTRVRRRLDKEGKLERIAVKSGQPIPRVR